MVVSGLSRDSLPLHPRPTQTWVLVGLAAMHTSVFSHISLFFFFLLFFFFFFFFFFCSFFFCAYFLIPAAHFLRNPSWGLGLPLGRMLAGPMRGLTLPRSIILPRSLYFPLFHTFTILYTPIALSCPLMLPLLSLSLSSLSLLSLSFFSSLQP